MNKNLAYILGVFLGDGSICSDKRTFMLQAIDHDFVKKTVSNLEKLSENNVSIGEENRLTKANKKVFSTRLSDVKFCNILQEITHNRKNLPIDFSEWDKVLQRELIS